MGLLKDIEDTFELWKRSSLVYKILSFSFAMAPLASISDSVFQWKGFILSGVEFYRTGVHFWFREALFYVGFERSIQVVDYLIFIGVLYLSSIYSVFMISEISFKSKLLLSINYISAFFVLLLLTSSSSGVTWFQWLIPIVMYISIPIILDYPYKISWYAPFIFAIASVPILAAVNIGLTRTS